MIGIFLLVAAYGFAASERADVVIYGGTAGGVMAALGAAGEGARVILVEPGNHVGGMLTGGLGRTDMDRQQHLIGGNAYEFFRRAGRHYGQDIAWFFEPKVAEKILRDWLADAKVTVRFGHPMARLRKDGQRLVELETRNGGVFIAKVFVDGTYEGDLLKAAGVEYAIGREGRRKYGESYAGRLELMPGNHQLRAPTSPFDDSGHMAPYVVPEEELVPVGEGDGKVMGFGFRLCLTNDAANLARIEKPAGYDPARFVLVRNYLKALGSEARLRDFAGISPMPNNKTDLNATTISTNLLGAGLASIEADYATRMKIWEEHRSWAHGLLWFLANEPVVPEPLQREAAQWGLPKDEFLDTGHWPHQLYVREGRRMLGEYVLTQHDLFTRRAKYDSIGMASYNVDIREIQWIAKTVTRFPKANKEVLMEGYLSMPVEPYQIPYRALLPKFGECSNLLVPLAISASHVAYASFRMEPQFMIVGQSAGVAAAMAAKQNVEAHHVDVPVLQKRLRALGQILALDGGPVGRREISASLPSRIGSRDSPSRPPDVEEFG